MEKVTNILGRKEPYLKFISPLSSINDALCRMGTERTEYLIVMEENDRYLGVITEHDIIARALFEELPLLETPVQKLMNVRLPVASTEDTVEQCLQRMWQYNVKLLPVFEEGIHFKGVVSAEDILKEVAWKRTEIFN